RYILYRLRAERFPTKSYSAGSDHPVIHAAHMHQTSRRLFPLLLLAAVAAAQQWVPVATQPRYRAGHGMATDPLTRRPLLFGGSAAYNWFATPFADADAWRWNGSAWYRLPTTAAPAAVDAMLMASDPLRRRVVLFANAAVPPATWQWDGRDWTLLAPVASPP